MRYAHMKTALMNIFITVFTAPKFKELNRYLTVTRGRY